jgi:chromosome segregation ATPase
LGEDGIESPLKQELESWKATAFSQTEQIDSLTEQNTKLRKNFLQAEGDADKAAKRFVAAEAKVKELHIELGNWQTQVAELRSHIETLKAENEGLRASPPVTQVKPPEAAELLNRLKAKRKKATASLADVEALLEILEELTPDGGN